MLRVNITMGFDSHGLDVASTWRRENSLRAGSFTSCLGRVNSPGNRRI